MAVETIKSIRDTFLYSVNNKNGDFDKIIATMLSKGIVADTKMLESQYTTINNYFKYPLKTNVIEAVESGIVKPMMFPKGISGVKVPTCFPFILTKSREGIVNAVAIIDNYATIDPDTKKVSIEANKFYTLIEGAYVARVIQMGFNSLRHNTNLYTHATSIYAHMFVQIINREYALNVDKTAYNKVLFLAAKFFLINVLQLKDCDAVFNYAIKAAGNISPIAIKRLNDQFPKEAYNNIAEFITSLARMGYMIINGMEKLTVRDYVAKFITKFSNSSLFALEHFAYFTFAVIATMNRAHITTVNAWEPVLGTQSGDRFYGYITNCARR
jgi:hypothetical protein